MIQGTKAQVILLLDNQWYDIKLSKLAIIETPEGTKVEIAGSVKDEEWADYEINNSK